MQLNQTTDYALRILLALSEMKLCASTELSDRLEIPKNYLMKVLRTLKKGGMIDADRGTLGGYFLAKDPEEISVLSVIELMEGTVKICRCLEDCTACSRAASGSCGVRRFYTELQKQLDDSLQRASIGSLLETEMTP